MKKSEINILINMVAGVMWGCEKKKKIPIIKSIREIVST